MNTPRRAGPLVRRYQWISIGLLMLVGIINILDRATLSIANSNICADLHLDKTQMGGLLSAFSFAYAFSQLPMGVVLDRLGSRLILGVGLLVWSVAQLCGGLVTSLSQFYFARVALGIGESPTFPAGAKVIADWFNKRERGGPTGIFLTSPTISPMIAPPILTALMLSVGWRQMFIVMGAIGIGIAVLWYWLARDRKDVALNPDECLYFDGGHDADSFKRKLSLAEWKGLFRQRTMWGIVLGFVGTIYSIWLYLTWLPGYLHDERHLTFAKTGWVAAIPYFFGMLGSLFCGYFADYLLRRGVSPINSRKWSICVGLVGSALFTAPVAYTTDNTTAVAYLCCLMFFLYMASGGAWALVNIATPNHMIATVGGFQNFGGYFGGSFAPIITGWLWERTHSFQTPLMVSAAMALLAAFVYFFLVKEPIRDLDHCL